MRYTFTFFDKENTPIEVKTQSDGESPIVYDPTQWLNSYGAIKIKIEDEDGSIIRMILEDDCIVYYLGCLDYCIYTDKADDVFKLLFIAIVGRIADFKDDYSFNQRFMTARAMAMLKQNRPQKKVIDEHFRELYDYLRDYLFKV